MSNEHQEASNFGGLKKIVAEYVSCFFSNPDAVTAHMEVEKRDGDCDEDATSFEFIAGCILSAICQCADENLSGEQLEAYATDVRVQFETFVAEVKSTSASSVSLN